MQSYRQSRGPPTVTPWLRGSVGEEDLNFARGVALQRSPGESCHKCERSQLLIRQKQAI